MSAKLHMAFNADYEETFHTLARPPLPFKYHSMATPVKQTRGLGGHQIVRLVDDDHRALQAHAQRLPRLLSG